MEHKTHHLSLFLAIFITAIFISSCQKDKPIPRSSDVIVKTNVKKKSSFEIQKIPVTLYKDPNCQCCERWATHMEENGFKVDINLTGKLNEIKDQNEVPMNLRSCHTALVKGYIVEGHVPANAIKKLLKAHSSEKGLAVAGMPAGAPGTMGPRNVPYDVFIFGQGQSLYGTYN